MSSDLQSPPAASPPHYRAVSMWAVLSLVCALATASMFFSGWAFFLPLAAVYFALKAKQQIRRLPEEYTGKDLADVGLWLGVGLGLIFSIWLLLGGNEVPHGYQRLEYDVLEPNPNVRDEVVPPAAQELSDKKAQVYIKGYILPPAKGKATGLTKFSICRTSDMCKFGMKLARPCDEIHIEMTGDRTINYTSALIGVGGIFVVDKDQRPQPYYLIQADYIYY